MKITNVREASVPPLVVTVAEAKLHCRVDHDLEDAMFARLLNVARRQCEQMSGWAFTTRTLVVDLAQWPNDGYLELPYPPLQSVTSIDYIDEIDGSHTVSQSDYIVGIHSIPGRVLLKANTSWPVEPLQVGNPISITYVAGFGTAEDVPDVYKQAMLLLVGHLYENRESIVVLQGVSAIQVPQAVEWLLLTDRVY